LNEVVNVDIAPLIPVFLECIYRFLQMKRYIFYSLGRLILSMASRVGERPTEALVKTAFEQIKERDVNEWLRNAFL